MNSETDLSTLSSLLPDSLHSFRILQITICYPLSIQSLSLNCLSFPWPTCVPAIPSFPSLLLPPPIYPIPCSIRSHFQDPKYRQFFQFFSMDAPYNVCFGHCLHKSGGWVDCRPRVFRASLIYSRFLSKAEFRPEKYADLNKHGSYLGSKEYAKRIRISGKEIGERTVKKIVFDANERGVRVREVEVMVKRFREKEFLDVAKGKYNLDRVDFGGNGGYGKSIEKDDGYVYFKEIFKGKKDDCETEVGYDEEVKSSFGFVVFKCEELDVKFRFWKVKVEKIRINLISSKSWTHLGKQLYNMEDPGFITLKCTYIKNINKSIAFLQSIPLSQNLSISIEFPESKDPTLTLLNSILSTPRSLISLSCTFNLESLFPLISKFPSLKLLKFNFDQTQIALSPLFGKMSLPQILSSNSKIKEHKLPSNIIISLEY